MKTMHLWKVTVQWEIRQAGTYRGKGKLIFNLATRLLDVGQVLGAWSNNLKKQIVSREREIDVTYSNAEITAIEFVDTILVSQTACTLSPEASLMGLNQ